ncbi:hypothetical protein H5410_020658 [Solanum commersonii]|uniref:Uncharacterized protein n=1 Tax=Solanum commersonii TaxID=4109 RepID=A0A9J5Z933_SOLCO|nr:hypothetical protein H5410_020658 [Solanum commersonii]
MDKHDLSQNSSKVTREGDLPLEQIDRIKETHVKQKKQGGEEITTIQASSKQSKRTIIVKNTKYL